MASEAAKNLEDLDLLIEKGQQKKAKSTWGYLVGSLVFPPFGLIVSLILAQKRTILYLVLPKVTILFSFLAGISVPLFYFALKPLTTMSGGFSQTGNSMAMIVFLSFLILIISVIGLVLGFYFAKRTRVEGKISNSAIFFLIAILLVGNLIIGINIYLVNAALYQQIDTIIQK